MDPSLRTPGLEIVNDEEDGLMCDNPITEGCSIISSNDGKEVTIAMRRIYSTTSLNDVFVGGCSERSCPRSATSSPLWSCRRSNTQSFNREADTLPLS